MDSDSASTVMKIVAYARVCFRMFPRSAFASAARAVSRGAHVEPEDLDLTGPGRDCPSAFDDDPAAPSVSPEDLSVSDISFPASLLPPARGAPSAELGGFSGRKCVVHFSRCLRPVQRPVRCGPTKPRYVRLRQKWRPS